MLSLVVPTYNERKSLEVLLPRLDKVASQVSQHVEVIVVDDNSPDGTAQFAGDFQPESEMTVRVVQRAGKFGLASAVIEGWRAARGELMGVMDADGSHDETILPALVDALVLTPAEVAVGSRYVSGGGMGDWPLVRQLISRVAVMLGSFLCPAKDVTSGYLLFRRDVLEGVSLDPIGFKIGLEVMVRGRYRTFTEVPYVFTDRKKGRSKLGGNEVLAYLVQLSRLLVYRYRHPHQRRRWEGAGNS
jgi:dolichol-phosphate mannosyltransferase